LRVIPGSEEIPVIVVSEEIPVSEEVPLPN